jgi:hypothetical protein
MSMTPHNAPVVQAKPQPDIYTMLLLLAVLSLALAIGALVYDMMSTYQMSLGEIFSGTAPTLPDKPM